MLPLESVPNFSEGRDPATIDAIGDALAAHARVLDVHTDADHNRSVFTVVGEDGPLVEALVAAVEVARERIDLRAPRGRAPADRRAPTSCRSSRCGSRTWSGRGRAALGLGERLGALGLPVFVYAPPVRGPAFYRRGGVEGLQQRIDTGELEPDFGPVADRSRRRRRDRRARGGR